MSFTEAEELAIQGYTIRMAHWLPNLGVFRDAGGVYRYPPGHAAEVMPVEPYHRNATNWEVL